MCTVTFIPFKKGCFITSNRDEKAARAKAISPALYANYNATLVYPKDAAANGTWIAMNRNGNAAVLLNGAFVKHEPMPAYRKSRGLIFLDIISSDEPVDWFAEINLHNIEPFTIIVWQRRKLYEFRWDANKKYFYQLDESQPHIWSSSTLYPLEVIQKRKQWFNQWLEKKSCSAQEDIFSFHQFAGDGDTQNDVLMNRDGVMLTVSITGMEINGDRAIMRYLDLNDKIICEKELDFETADKQFVC